MGPSCGRHQIPRPSWRNKTKSDDRGQGTSRHHQVTSDPSFALRVIVGLLVCLLILRGYQIYLTETRVFSQHRSHSWRSKSAYDVPTGDDMSLLVVRADVARAPSDDGSQPTDQTSEDSMADLAQATPMPQDHTLDWRSFTSIAEFDDYRCEAWRQTANCSAFGTREPSQDRSCGHVIAPEQSGYCEFRHRTTGDIRRVMPWPCQFELARFRFTCDLVADVVRYNLLALDYSPRRSMAPSRCLADLIDDNEFSVASNLRRSPPLSFDTTRGIVMVVYEKLLLSAFASIRQLRATGCNLPIELWYDRQETDPQHPILQTLVQQHRAFLRELRDPRATKFYTKMYAVAYSAFDQVLLLDADNFITHDPTHVLFSSEVFRTTGAIFWPDFWRPNRTIFGGMKEKSPLWTILGIRFTDMFEQESGQVLIDRLRHPRALRALLHYALTEPHYPALLNLAWGDKDLFRFAWMRTNSSFHMITRPPGSAGLVHRLHQPSSPNLGVSEKQAPPATPTDGNDNQIVFCGHTMVQHDPDGEILFLHRNIVKFTAATHERLWTHVQQFRRDHASLADYDVRGVVDLAHFPMIRKCYGKHSNHSTHYEVRAIGDLGLADLETRLIEYVHEGQQLLGDRVWKST